MMQHYLVFISHRVSTPKYIYFVPNAESSLKAQLEAFKRFQRVYDVDEDEWLLRSVELSLNTGLQFVEVM